MLGRCRVAHYASNIESALQTTACHGPLDVCNTAPIACHNKHTDNFFSIPHASTCHSNLGTTGIKEAGSPMATPTAINTLHIMLKMVTGIQPAMSANRVVSGHYQGHRHHLYCYLTLISLKILSSPSFSLPFLYWIHLLWLSCPLVMQSMHQPMLPDQHQEPQVSQSASQVTNHAPTRVS